MIKALKLLVVSVLTLACLYVAIEFFLGFSGYGRYRPDIRPDVKMRRYPPPPSRYQPDREEEEEDPAVDEEMTESDHPKETMPVAADSRDS